jgi:4a-hydroxytetrahydrobiopterin dehydratase
MARPSKLDDEEVERELSSCQGWCVIDGKLHRSFHFADFNEAFGFMTRAALVAETLNHHPEWLNVYDRVVVDLVTHDAHGITLLDFELARAMNRLAG